MRFYLSIWLVPTLAVVLFCACKSDPADKAPPPETGKAKLTDIVLPDLHVKTQVPVAPSRRLIPTAVPDFENFKVPVQAKYLDVEGDDVNYIIGASLTELIAFYREEGFTVSFNPSGATVTDKDGKQALLLPNGSKKVQMIFVSSLEEEVPKDGVKPVPIPPEKQKEIERALAKEKGYLD